MAGREIVCVGSWRCEVVVAKVEEQRRQTRPTQPLCLYCPENPTPLPVRDLWNHPTDVAKFMKLEREEDDHE